MADLIQLRMSKEKFFKIVELLMFSVSSDSMNALTILRDSIVFDSEPLVTKADLKQALIDSGPIYSAEAFDQLLARLPIPEKNDG